VRPPLLVLAIETRRYAAVRLRSARGAVVAHVERLPAPVQLDDSGQYGTGLYRSASSCERIESASTLLLLIGHRFDALAQDVQHRCRGFLQRLQARRPSGKSAVARGGNARLAWSATNASSTSGSSSDHAIAM
jgi:hypothetical protein